MNKKEITNRLLEFVDSLFPNAKCELFYNQDYELVIAVMLSAQTTDKAVNKCTKLLFGKYQTLQSLQDAEIKDIEDIIKSIGLYKNKARNIKGIAHKLLTHFNGVLPSDKNELQTLDGIGNKSAGVIRCEIFKIPDLPVDTHIMRIAKRLSLAKKNDSPLDIELKLKKLVPEDRWIITHHQLIHFGRYFCLAKKPQCENCKLRDICQY